MEVALWSYKLRRTRKDSSNLPAEENAMNNIRCAASKIQRSSGSTNSSGRRILLGRKHNLLKWTMDLMSIFCEIRALLLPTCASTLVTAKTIL